MKLFVARNEPRQLDVTQFELEGWIDNSPFEELLDMHIKQVADGQATLSMLFTVMLANGGGVMHGGAMTALADTAVAMAIKSLLPPGTTFATTALTMNFVAPVLAGEVIAHAKICGPQGRTFHGVCELRSEQDELYASFTSVFKVARRQR
jgi:uncharacterized protein (TIGR00369 family)